MVGNVPNRHKQSNERLVKTDLTVKHYPGIFINRFPIGASRLWRAATEGGYSVSPGSRVAFSPAGSLASVAEPAIQASWIQSGDPGDQRDNASL